MCLVKFPQVPVPEDWSGDEWLDLQGVRFTLFGVAFDNFAWDPRWSRFVDVVATFAREARSERRGRSESINGPPNRRD